MAPHWPIISPGGAADGSVLAHYFSREMLLIDQRWPIIFLGGAANSSMLAYYFSQEVLPMDPRWPREMLPIAPHWPIIFPRRCCQWLYVGPLFFPGDAADGPVLTHYFSWEVLPMAPRWPVSFLWRCR